MDALENVHVGRAHTDTETHTHSVTQVNPHTDQK